MNPVLKHVLSLAEDGVWYLGGIDFDFPSGLYSVKDAPGKVVIGSNMEELLAIGGERAVDWAACNGDIELETEIEDLPNWWDEGALTLINRPSRLLDLGSFGPSAGDFLEAQGFVTQCVTDWTAGPDAEYSILAALADGVAKHLLDVAFYESFGHTIWFVVPAGWELPEEWIAEDKMPPMA